MSSKKCTKCGVVKALNCYYRNGKAGDSRASQCKECTKEHSRRQHTELKHVKRKYGCSPQEYRERMSTSVVCQICGSGHDLVYDHCHETLEFRGVLCRKCNRGLGLFGDNLEGINRVVKYLKKETEF